MRTENKFCIFHFAVVGFFLLLTISCSKSSSQPDILPTSDVDGNVYNTVTIGSQVWMVENLNTTRYNNGDPIPTVTDNTQWATLTSGALCTYNNVTPPNSYYGKLYNWFAVNDPRNIAPPGWHVATNEDWIELENFVASNSGASGSVAKILAAGIDWIISTSVNAVGNDLNINNISGFSGLPGGIRSGIDGSFSNFGLTGAWWSSSENNVNTGWRHALNNNQSIVDKSNISKTYGFTVRCVKN